MATTAANEPVDSEAAKIWNCINCRRRKVRCDRLDPCSSCSKLSLDCHYPVSGRVARRNRAPTTWESSHKKQTDLLQRVQKLEAIVTELATQMSPDGHDSGEPEFGQLLANEQGKIRIGNGFWSVFCDEIDEIFGAIQAADEQDSNTQTPSHDGISRHFPFPHHSISTAEIDVILSPSLNFIWETFIRKVDPFIKVMCTPRTRRLFASPGQNDVDETALVYAVALSTVAALDAQTVSEQFTIGKSELLVAIRSALENQLCKADFLSTTNLVTIQALTIYVFALPYIGEIKTTSQMTGILLQLAIDTCAGISVQFQDNDVDGRIDNEIRKRIWWHTCFLARRSLQKSLENSITSRLPTIQLPGNVGDAELSEAKQDGDSNAQMVIFLIRCELWTLATSLRHQQGQGLADIMQTIQNSKKDIFTKYLRDPPDERCSRQSFAASMTILFFSKLEQSIYIRYLHDIAADSCRKRELGNVCHAILGTSLKALEACHDMTTEEWAQEWSWQLRGQFPWHAMRIVFLFLLRQPWTKLSEGSWILAHKVAAVMPAVEPDVEAAIYRLMKQVDERREHEMSDAASFMLGRQLGVEEMLDMGSHLFYSEETVFRQDQIPPSMSADSTLSSGSSPDTSEWHWTDMDMTELMKGWLTQDKSMSDDAWWYGSELFG